MKRFRIPFPKVIFAAAVVALASCGTSRKAERYRSQPDRVVPATGQYVTPPARPSSKKLTAEERLAARLDSLLITADTLLRHTQLGLRVLDLTSGQELYAVGAQQRMRPASAEKVVTAIVALDCLGPDYAFTTQLLATGALKGSTLHGDLYIKGAMDPLLTAADCRQLASQLRAAGIRTVSGRLVADASMKDDDEYGWGWCWDDDNPVLSPMLVGGKPGLAAALRAALKNAGISIGKGILGTAPADARVLATVSRPLTEVLLPMMKESDNLCAEAVFYQIRRPATAPPGTAVNRTGRGKHASRNRIAPIIEEVITQAFSAASNPSPTPLVGGTAGSTGGAVVADGSGLSLYNYQTPETFTRLLAYAAMRPEAILQPLMAALPIASVDGTLKNRMAGTAAAANVRAKTGTVTAVSTLVGYTTQRSTGHLLAFAIMNQGVPRTAYGRAFQDSVCAVLSE